MELGSMDEMVAAAQGMGIRVFLDCYQSRI